MIEYLSSLFFMLSQVLGIQSDPLNRWGVIEPWNSQNGFYVFTAEMKQPLCQQSEDLIQFPQVIHGVHTLIVNNKVIYKSGDPNFNIATPFYFAPAASCALLQSLDHDDKVIWQVKTYSAFFARFDFFPKIETEKNYSTFFDLQLNLMSFGLLFFIMIFSLVMFRKKIPTEQMVAMSLASISLGLYSLFCINQYVMIDVSMLTAHKLADIALSLGCQFYLYVFYKNKLLSQSIFRLNLVAAMCFVPLIIFGTNGDMVQLGTTMQMPYVFLGFLNIAMRSVEKINFKEFDLAHTIELASVLLFILCGLNDILRIFGLLPTFMILPIGAACGVFFLAAAVNRDIEMTYDQRDDLLLNLKNKVNEQTQHLTLAMDQLKKSQADLVQSSRLALLGTLSAGIAHEINNAINYVNGSIVPLEKKIIKYIPENEVKNIQMLFSAMKQGTQLTVEIVKSLRNFTGLNQAKIKDVNLYELIQSILVILKSRMRNIEVDIQVDKNMMIYCYQIGMNQILMNLLSNAIDVVPKENGKIQISAHVHNQDVILKVSDNGCGMSDELKTKIFDPFFTTKEVGDGTGLGLHIVSQEVEKLKGKIRVISEVNKGTEFTIQFPAEINFIDKLKEAS